jgi:hypothetical protein
MLINNDYYFELLQGEELAFLKKKVKKESRLYDRLKWVLFIGAAIISFAGSWKNVLNKEKNFATQTIFSWENYFITFCILAFIFYLAMRVLQSAELTKLKKDIKQKQKVVERVKIERKTYLPHNDTYHFYLNSLQKISIQVDESDFDKWEQGDEISIEYSKNAIVYFGYF